ncbi:hypothetical protein MC862_001795 [Proteus mirabilis]|nr:hypothetical protein [Proteus mirabilis]
MNKKIFDVKLLISFLWFIIFFPQIQFKVGLLLEQFLSFISILLIILYLFLYKKNINLNHIIIIFIYFSLISISILRSSFDEIILNDYFELAKPLYLGLFFIFSYSIEWNEEKLIYFINNLLFCFLFGSILSIFESNTVIGNEVFHTLYKDHRYGVQYKAVLSFISPYVYASILLVPIFILLANLFYKLKTIYVFFFIIIFYSFLLTQSRTIFLSFIITFILFIFYVFFTKHYIARYKFLLITFLLSILLISIIPFIILLIKNNFSYLYSGLEVVFNNLLNLDIDKFIYSSPSIYLRYEQFVYVLEHIDFLPIIGIGIGKSVLMPESFYALYLYRVGLIGIFIHFTIILYAFIKCKYLSEKYNRNQKIHCFFIGLQMYFLSLPFSYASSAINDQVRSGFIFYILLGIIFKLNRERIQ